MATGLLSAARFGKRWWRAWGPGSRSLGLEPGTHQAHSDTLGTWHRFSRPQFSYLSNGAETRTNSAEDFTESPRQRLYERPSAWYLVRASAHPALPDPCYLHGKGGVGSRREAHSSLPPCPPPSPARRAACRFGRAGLCSTELIYVVYLLNTINHKLADSSVAIN